MKECRKVFAAVSQQLRASLMCYKVIYIYMSQDVHHLFALISTNVPST